MKKMIAFAVIILLAIMTTMNIGATSSWESMSSTPANSEVTTAIPSVSTEGPEIASDANSGLTSRSAPGSIPSSAVNTAWGPTMSELRESSRSSSVVSRKTQEEIAAEDTIFLLQFIDQYYEETGYTDAQKAEADAALQHIYESLYLSETGESQTIAEVKQLTIDFLKKRMSGFTYMNGSIMPYHYVSITDLKGTGEIVLNPYLTGDGAHVYSVLAQDQNGRIAVAVTITPSLHAFSTQYAVAGECYELKSYAVKAYELLKTTDLDLSKTKAVFFVMNDFLPTYYLTDGSSRYFLTFGSTDKAAGEQYVEWSLTSVNFEYRMSVIRYENLIQLIRNIDTSNMVDHPYGWCPPMGGGEEAASVESAIVASFELSQDIISQTENTDAPSILTNPIFTRSALGIGVVVLVLLIVFAIRRKKNP